MPRRMLCGRTRFKKIRNVVGSFALYKYGQLGVRDLVLCCLAQVERLESRQQSDRSRYSVVAVDGLELEGEAQHRQFECVMVDHFIWPLGNHDISHARTEGTVLAPEQGCCGVCICGTTTIPSLMVDFEALGIVCSLTGQSLDSHLGAWRGWSSRDRLWNDL
jgi:hypothetical protein